MISRMAYFAAARDERALVDMAEHLSQRDMKTASDLVVAALSYGYAVNLSLGWSGNGNFTPPVSDAASGLSQEQKGRLGLAIARLKDAVAAGSTDGLDFETANAFIMLQREREFDTVVMTAYQRAVTDALAASRQKSDPSTLAPRRTTSAR